MELDGIATVAVWKLRAGRSLEIKLCLVARYSLGHVQRIEVYEKQIS